jgi:hypothetical protein
MSEETASVTDMTLNDPAEMTMNDPDGPTTAEAEYDRNGVRRSKDGRPYVKNPCPNGARAGGDCIDGRVPGKRAGTTKQCPKCKGAGEKEILYTRCTSFVGALEDRNGLELWMKRTVLVGVGADYRLAIKHPDSAHGLLARLLKVDLDDRETLDVLADEAFTAGEGYEKAQKGTDLHGLTERVDAGEDLGDVSLADRRDMAAWVRTMNEYGFRVLDVEKFVVNDGLKIGGTYDRRVTSYDERTLCPICDADIGEETPPKPKVLDLKTGRVDYGGGKMRQQVATYANSDGYDAATAERSPHVVCPHLGFILHIAAGTGEGRVYAMDLTKGWQDVQLSAQVREHRRESKGALHLLDDPLELTVPS